MHKLPQTANNTDMLSKIAKLTLEAQNESNRYCEKNRRFGANRHTKRNSQDTPYQNGRPLTENIDTGFGILHECGIRCGTVHRELNTREPPSDCEYQAAVFGYAFFRYSVGVRPVMRLNCFMK